MTAPKIFKGQDFGNEFINKTSLHLCKARKRKLIRIGKILIEFKGSFNPNDVTIEPNQGSTIQTQFHSTINIELL
jgi:hypothetical protein